MSVATGGCSLITYVATLDVPRHVAELPARLLETHRRQIGTPRHSRTLGPFRQAVLVLSWCRDRGCVHCLARDAGVAQATGYRYLHEGIDVLADQAPDLHQVLSQCQLGGMAHVILDGTLIKSDRLAGVRENGNDLWFSQKHKAFGGNIQFLSPAMARRFGSPTSNRAPPRTSPPPASMACPRSTKPPPEACRHSRTGATSVRASASMCPSAAPRASPSKHFTPTPGPRTP